MTKQEALELLTDLAESYTIMGSAEEAIAVAIDCIRESIAREKPPMVVSLTELSVLNYGKALCVCPAQGDLDVPHYMIRPEPPEEELP